MLRLQWPRPRQRPDRREAAVLRAAGCDRACLASIAETYFAAAAAHDPARAPMAPGARLAENAQILSLGEGLWKTSTGAPTTFKIYVPDPVSGLDYFSTNGWSDLPR